MLSLPAGIIGGLAALALTGKAINILCFIGIILLDGLASKNGTLLIDYTNTLMKRGLKPREALIESGSTRLRPIVMTSVTMIVGMLPLAISTGLELSRSSRAWRSLLIGGLVTSTIISPLPPPRAYTLIDEARRRALALREARLARRSRRGAAAFGSAAGAAECPTGVVASSAGGSARSAEVPLPTAPGALR